MRDDDKPDILTRFRLRKLLARVEALRVPKRPDWLRLAQDRTGLIAMPSILFLVLAATWVFVSLTLFLGFYAVLWQMIFQDPPQGQEAVWNWRFSIAQLVALTTVTGAVIALPITLNRLVLTRRQTEAAENTLFNEKVNSATTDLAARREVTREIGQGAQKRILSEWQDDILVRAAAIDRLEVLAEERPAEAPRIARTLALYVRELSRDYPAKPPPERENPDETREWASALKPARPDMESAVQSLGRMNAKAKDSAHPIEIDLRRANLQGFILTGLNFERARFEGAYLQGANLNWARLQGATLPEAKLQGASLMDAQLQGASLMRAQLQGADLKWARFDCWTLLIAASLRGAAVSSLDFTDISQIAKHVQNMFGDASVTLPGGHGPEHESWPAHWPKFELGIFDFDDEWHKWQSEPDNYQPPEPPKPEDQA